MAYPLHFPQACDTQLPHGIEVTLPLRNLAGPNGGVYVPTLSRAILDGNDAGGFHINLAGLAAGRGSHSSTSQLDVSTFCEIGGV
jgi:hypothetical protein